MLVESIVDPLAARLRRRKPQTVSVHVLEQLDDAAALKS